MELTLSNRDFCIYLLTQFPFAVDEEKEMMLSDYIMEYPGMPSEDWIEELSGKTGKDGQKTEPWNGYTYVHQINPQVTFYAEFHPYNTVYFFNDIYLGNTGGHFHLSLLSWQEFKQIVAKDKYERSPLFLLLLPLTIGRNRETSEIEHAILEELRNTSLAFTEEQLQEVVKFICRHVVFKEEEKNILTHREAIGLVTNRNHSERNHQHTDEELVSINEIIRLATGKN